MSNRISRSSAPAPQVNNAREGDIFRFQNGAADHYYIKIASGMVSLKTGTFYTLGDRTGIIDIVAPSQSITLTVE